MAQSPACSVRVQGLTIQADSCDRDTDADTLELEGNIQILFKDQHLRCDRTKVNFRARSLDAQGNVVLTSPMATVGGSRVLLDYEANTGMIFDGYVQSGPILFEGSSIAKLGESEYLTNSARFTACSNCPETWSFSGQRIRAELGGYAFIKNSWFRIGGIPVLWLPYLAVPLKSDRQTGFLTPEIEQSGGGWSIGPRFFWAISRSQDATFTFKNYSKRGPKGLVNYRYVLGENSSGELDTAFSQDRVFGDDPRLNAFRPPAERNQPISRWFAKYEHYLELPEGFINRMQINNASDLQYAKDFPLEAKNHAEPTMENRISLTKNTGNHHFMVDSSYYVNMLRYDPVSNNNDAVHRVPEIRYAKTLSKLGDSDWLYSFDLNSTQFARSEFGYDDMNAAYNPSGTNDRHIEAGGPSPDCLTDQWYNNPVCTPIRDGEFDPNKDLIRTGNRLDLRGTLTRFYRIGEFIDLVPQISYRDTTYQFNTDRDSQNTRRFLRTELSTRTTFSRIYGDTVNTQSPRYKHEIQPEVTLTTIPWLNHPSHPFFGSQSESPFYSQESISDADINSPNGLQFDYNDRLYDRKVATFGLVNRIIQKRWRENGPEYRQVLFWKISQSYDFYQAESNIANRQPLSDITSDLLVNVDRVQLYQRANHYPYQRATNLSTRLRYNFAFGDFVQLGHVLNYRDISSRQDIDFDNRTEDLTLSLLKSFPVVDILARLTYDMNPRSRSASGLKSYGYGAQLKLPGDCLSVYASLYRSTGGEDFTFIGFNFSWDGQKQAPLPESLLDAMIF